MECQKIPNMSRRSRTAALLTLSAGLLLLMSVACGESGSIVAVTTTAGDSTTTVRTRDSTSTTTTTQAGEQAVRFTSLEELHAAILSSGVSCGPLVDDEAPSGNPYQIPFDTPGLQGRCATGPGTAFVFSIADPPDLATKTREVITTMNKIASSSRPRFILVGPNWFINLSDNADAANKVHDSLGGDLRTLDGA